MVNNGKISSTNIDIFLDSGNDVQTKYRLWSYSTSNQPE
jgi:hypothetical protein